jgi:hypothetical protein
VLLQSASSPYKILHHRLGSKPPTGSKDDDLVPVDARFICILGPSVTYLLDGVFNHFKASLGEALPHHCIHVSATPRIVI